MTMPSLSLDFWLYGSLGVWFVWNLLFNELLSAGAQRSSLYILSKFLTIAMTDQVSVNGEPLNPKPPYLMVQLSGSY